MRKNIKKLAAVGLTAVLGAGLLAGCGGDGKSSGGKTEITFGNECVGFRSAAGYGKNG